MKKVKIKKNKKILFLLIVLLLILLVIIFSRNWIKDFFVPIYEVKDRTSNVEKYKKKYKKDSIIGWLRVQGTNIDYPIREGPYSDYIYDYVWMNLNTKKLQDYMPIFGHNLANVSIHPIVGDNSMSKFEQLMSFVYDDFAKQNKYIQLTIDGKNYLYQIYAVSMIQSNDIKSFYYNVDSKNKDKFIKDAKKNSFYKYDVDVTNKDKLISLYTCTRMFGYKQINLKVDGKLVKNSNKGYNYGMHEKESYKKIKKILEGDGEDV